MRTYSEVVNQLQGDKLEGAKQLVKIADFQQQQLQIIEQLEKDLAFRKNELAASMNTSNYIIKHLELEVPYMIIDNKNVLIVKENTVIDVANANYVIPSAIST